MFYAKNFEKDISPNKQNLVNMMERTIAHYFYSCVRMAHLKKVVPPFYDVMYQLIYNNPFLLENSFGIIESMVNGIRNEQVK